MHCSHALVQDREEAFELGVGNRQWRAHVDCAPERAQVGAALARLVIDSPADLAKVALAAVRQIRGADHSEGSYPRDARGTGESLERAGDEGSLSHHLIDDSLVP